jgi:hypothetical protein
MIDMTRFTAPKSDQLNADDLIAGPRTVRIREVREMGSAEQPLAIFYDGDEGKPYKPCKSMMRALMFVWGPDGREYVGKSMTLWRDPTVTWGGEAIGGIRISHMSDIRAPMEFPLTATRGRRLLYKVEPLVERQRKTLEDHVAAYAEAVAATVDLDALMTVIGSEGANKVRDAIGKLEDEPRRNQLRARMAEAERARRTALEPVEETAGDDLETDQFGRHAFAGDEDELDDGAEFPGEPQ